MNKLRIFSLIKTECGRSKYQELSLRKNLFSRIRLIWFIIIATIKDWNIEEDKNN